MYTATDSPGRNMDVRRQNDNRTFSTAAFFSPFAANAAGGDVAAAFQRHQVSLRCLGDLRKGG